MAKKKTTSDTPALSAPKLYTTLGKSASAEYTEKKSVFIGYASPVKTEQEALDFINAVRKKHSDARHNVFAYQLNGGGIARYSDDGEPQGTAGVPVLEVIKKSGADDCVIVVTRYFGGILLGASGLVRAYSTAAKSAVDAAGVVTYESYREFTLECGYSEYQRVEAELPKYGVIVDSSDFGGNVAMRLAVKAARYDEFSARLAEMFAGRVVPEPVGERFDFR